MSRQNCIKNIILQFLRHMQNNYRLGYFFSKSKLRHTLLQLTLAVSILIGVSAQEIVNDHMFHAQSAAKAFSDFDNKGFLINGKRTFLVSAGLEYARMPRELWYDRLLRLKRGGFNCVEIYTIWNFHEPREGQFEFSGEQNLDRFLSLVKQLGMYAIVRVGPYYCAEWDHGGYPLWLRFKPGLRVREDNPEFEKYVDKFFDQLLPIVFKHQINKGGSVIMVQLENEHPKGWGTDMPDNYFKHLQSKSLSMGMEVPYLFSGVHHSTDPAGDGMLDDAKRPNPWFSTEFWSLWYTQYGAKPEDAPVYDRRTWKVIAHGGSGYNFYMAHGGSNFGYTNNDEDAASYDYGAAVGQAGDLRPIYYTFKRAGYFARSFQEILENSSDATRNYSLLMQDTVVKVTARTSPAGTLVFLDNSGSKPITKTIAVAKGKPAITYSLAPGEIYPLVHQFKINEQVMLDWALTRIYGVARQNNTTTILVEANANDQLSLYFTAAVKPVITLGATDFKISGNKISLNKIMKSYAGPAEYVFKVGKEQVRLLIMDRLALDRTWVIEDDNLNGIITGPSYLGKTMFKNGVLSLDAEYPATASSDHPSMIYLEKGAQRLQLMPANQIALDSLLQLSAWENKSATVYANATYNDKQWLDIENPQQMGVDGDVTNSAWYRNKLEVPATGKYTLQIEGGDRGTVFIDGQLLANWKIREGEVTLDLKKGTHQLAIFTAHDGRDKMAAYLGPIDNIDKKGLSGVAVLKKGGPFIHTLENWYFTSSLNADAVKQGPPVLDTLKGIKYKIGADAFNLKEGYGWFQTVIPVQKDLSRLILNFKSTDENATVFINNKQVLRHEGWNIPFDWKITDPAMLSKPIVLSVFIENVSKEGGIDQPVKINTIGEGTILKGWKMKGGIDTAQSVVAWRKLNTDETLSGPQLYRSTFILPQANDHQQIWRVNTTLLGHGSVWVNGHNLGRYPEKNGDIGMYIPEPWLKTGINDIMIYDEDGKTPGKITISAEKAAGRVKYKLTGNIN